MLATKHAAIIGINAYESGIAPLESAVSDARAIAAVLARDHGYASPHLLLDGEATGAAILRLLEETLPAAVGAESSVVLYYAGHGVALGDGSEGPEGFLLPQDARPGDESTWLPMERVREALSRLACKHLLVVLDCCFAGSFRWASSRSFVPIGRPLYDSQYARFLSGTAWQVLTSASHQEKALDVSPGCRDTRGGAGSGHSPFAAALLKGLAGEADSTRGRHDSDGVMTATELHQFIFEELVPPGTRSRQTPGIWPLKPENAGEFLFLAPGREKKTRPDPPLDDTNNPWLGLSAYGREDASLFFGRERVVEEILARLLDPARPPLLAVVGASGTGKSSVVRAGVLPRLEAPPERQAEKIGAWTVARLPRLQGDPRPLLDEALRELAEVPAGRRRLLFIDQFEELYTQCPDSEAREGFLRRLRELMSGEAPLQVVITLRSDFEPRLAASQDMGPLLAASRYLVPAMTSAELRDVIEKPAEAKALYFEPEALVGELVDEVMAMPGGLPLLSFALAEMYRQAQLRRRAAGALDRALTREDYTAAGGVVGALHRRAGELYDAADPARRETIRRLFLRMVSQEGGRLARRRVEERELDYPDLEEQERVRRVLDDYVAARLLVADEGWVEPAHDTLVLAWDNLLAWLGEGGSQELVRQLWEAASAWERSQREQGRRGAVGLLWNQDPRLPLVQDRYLGGKMPPARPGELNRIEREFAARSVARKRSRRNLVAGTTAAAIVILSVVTGLALWQQGRAEKEARTAGRVTGFLSNMFQELDPYKVALDKNSLPQILDRSRDTIEKNLAGEPEAQDKLRATIGAVYLNLGSLRPAEELLRQVVAFRRGSLGEEHPDTLTAKNDLANVYRDQARFKEAEDLYRQVLESRRRLLGEEHPDTLKSMNNLANVYRDTGRLKAAEELYGQASETARRVLGDRHPDTLKTMHNLATVYVEQGRLGEGEELLRQVLEIRRVSLGPEHPDTLGSMSSLANAVSARGRPQEAEKLNRRALEISRRVMGEEHPDTLMYADNLANTYVEQGRLEEAEKSYNQNLALRRRIQGEEHPDTISSMNNLAVVARDRGRLKEAEDLLRRVVEIDRRALGEEHRDTLSAMTNLAAAYVMLNRLAEAETLQRQVLTRQRRVLGEAHPDALKSLNNLAAMVRAQNRPEEAVGLLRQAVALLRRELGDEHPDTLRAMNQLAGMYREDGRLQEAEVLHRQVLAGFRRVLGDEHPDTVWTMGQLAAALQKQGRLPEAETLYVQVLEHHRRVLGEKNMTTLVAMNNLAGVYRAQGRATEADELMRRALELFQQMPEGKPK